jgi:hypothetical protein
VNKRSLAARGYNGKSGWQEHLRADDARVLLAFAGNGDIAAGFVHKVAG